MSTHKHIDRICAAAMALALLLTLVFLHGEALGLQPAEQTLGYEDRLFDTGRVHTIDIVIDDWDGFLETAQQEEYTLCDVVIDGEAVQNVGIRGKGNTSLSTVASMDSNRYSFKLEFDQYDSGKTYHGLDKLSLNNLIQDNTYMKDYLTYRMMNEFGAAAPLCSFAWITVNGEAWGLYLAAEAVEDAFLQRNYGADHGDLYKPDSMDMGGGRGNGRDFNMEDFMADMEDPQSAQPQDFAPGSFKPGNKPEGFEPGTMPEGFEPGTMPEGFAPGGMGRPNGGRDAMMRPDEGGMMHPGQGGMELPGMGGGQEARLQYIDDDPASYAVIFNNAKTEVTAADQARLIHSLQTLGSGDAEAALDLDAVLRYFVVHNYVVNGDSYTGSMIHNYYLYEQDGRLSMIPWDYNLAFGTFQSQNADSAVNDSIDSPLSVTGSGDRPMVDWIFQNQAHTDLYHQYFAAFLDTVDPATLIEEARTLIAPYVQQDPTAFCTYEEFLSGVEALQTFCRLRTQSVENQLSGSAEPVDASQLDLSDMGTMNHGGPGTRNP